jgi:pimeloyl-ACP methyl ester carboxylesterase
VFVHGVFVNGDLWRYVAPELARAFRCIVPDWPLGSHDVAMNADADLSPPGLAQLIGDFLAALDLDGVTLVGNDTGGAFCQLVVTEHPERIARLVLTPCDAYDNFPPRIFRYLRWGPWIPGFLALVGQLLRVNAVRQLPIAFGWLSKRPIERDALDAYARPLWTHGAVRRDLGKVLRGISPRYTQAAAKRLGEFKRPVLIAWAPEDRLFPFEHARMLSETFPNARLEPIRDSLTFIPEDQPQDLARLIADFVSDTPRDGLA